MIVVNLSTFELREIVASLEDEFDGTHDVCLRDAECSIDAGVREPGLQQTCDGQTGIVGVNGAGVETTLHGVEAHLRVHALLHLHGLGTSR